MKQTPILFNTQMVQAILEGRKTHTRRLVKDCSAKHLSMRQKKAIGESGRNYICPYGQVGDVLWVRETYLNFNSKNEKPNYVYKADHPNFHVNFASGERWKPSIHMPKAACRIWLKITNVRVERLKDISEADAIKEGIIGVQRGGGYGYGTSIEWDYKMMLHEKTPIIAFKGLWQ